MTSSFGSAVKQAAEVLSAQGKDANQIAKIVCDRDPDGFNYGIGIVVDGQGQAWPTSETLLNYARTELGNSLLGEYMSTASACPGAERGRASGGSGYPRTAGTVLRC